MGKYDKILILFVGLLIFFVVIMVFRIGCTPDDELAVDQKGLQSQEDVSLKVRVEAIEQRQKELEEKLFNIDDANSEDIDSPEVVAVATSPLEIELSDYLITETVTKENLSSKAVWNPTNTAGLYLVSVKLEHLPIENSLLIWTGSGILPLNSYRLKGNVLSIVMQQPQGQFIAESDFINVRYFRK